MTTVEAFEQIADHLALIAPQNIVEFKAPASMAERVEDLIYKKKEQGITSEESTELESHLALDLLINLAKIHLDF